MRKHLARLIFFFICFESLRGISKWLLALFKGLSAPSWTETSGSAALYFSSIFLFLLYVLSSFVVFERFFNKHKKKAIILFLLLVIAIITTRYLVQEVFFKYYFNLHNYLDNIPPLFYLIDNLYYASLYSSFGIIYFLFTNEKRNAIKHAQLALENKESQLSFLQSQINPHFLFNTLNNIYSLIYHHSPNALTAVSYLSELMRYMIYDAGEKTILSKEIDYIQKLIVIQGYRFDHDIIVKQEISGETDTVYLPPLLLIPFIENAFKHGKFDGKGTDLEIHIHVNEREFTFFVKNKKSLSQQRENTGIGLNNVRKRLLLIYPEKHALTIHSEGDFFIVHLKLQYV
jgi:two-component system LytT family sensor kinase